MTYGLALLLDVMTVLAVLTLLVRSRRFSSTHPASAYLVFHVFTFTWRLLALWDGAPTLFSDWGPAYLPLKEAEIIRVVQMADCALIVMTVAWLKAVQRPSTSSARTFTAQSLDPRVVWAVVAIAFPIGMWALLTQNYVSLQSGISRDPDASGYLLILPTWPGLCFLALIYIYGFRSWLVTPMTGYLLLMSLQGYHRFRIVIPVILLLQFWLSSQKRRWPSLPLASMLIAVSLLFFPLKHVGKLVQQGAGLDEITDRSGEIISDVLRGDASDQRLLDAFASAVSLVDENERHFWGKPYLALLVLPIPRALWPEKPTTNAYIYEISRPWRPIGETGAAITVLGEAYANFAQFGLVLIPAALAWALARAWQYSDGLPWGSIGTFGYLLVGSNLIQVYRDGLGSLVFFVLIHMMPLVTMVAVQWVLSRRTKFASTGSWTRAPS